MQDLRRRFRRRFALISTAVTLVAAIGLAFLITWTSFGLGISIGEVRHREMGRDFYTAAERSAEVLRQARSAGPEALRRHPEIERLNQIANSYSRMTRLVRLKIHDADGLTLFSTAPAEIGAFPERKRKFDAALEAGSASSRREVAGFPDIEGRSADRIVIETFVAIRNGAGRPAVISVSSDTRGYYDVIRGQLFLLIAVVVGALFAVLGMLIFYVGRDRVLQEQQQRNAALTESVRLAEEASRLKSRFFASMGHELRTPLNAIIGFSEAMKAKVFGPLGAPKYEEYAGTIHSSGRHLLAVVDDILDMARIEGGKAMLHESVFSLRGALANCAHLIAPEAERAGELFVARVPDGLPAVRGDEAKIKQIVLNLLSNAVRYTPRGGRVTLSAEFRADGAVVIAVSDNGIGIPASELQHVFEPFRQVDDANVKKGGGLGLGLNIAKSFAELHSAELTLESDLGRGTTARLVLPAERLIRGAALSAAA
jgi:signal transduction histidine kinase